MENKPIRFVNGYGGMMIKFCDDCLVIASHGSAEKKKATQIPYELITSIKFNSWSGLRIAIKDHPGYGGNGPGIYIQEKKQINAVVDNVVSKINKPTDKKTTEIPLTFDDMKFIEIATKIKQNKPVTEQERKAFEDTVDVQHDTTKKGKFKIALFFVGFGVLCLILVVSLLALFGFFDSPSSSSSKKDGFIGSDGKYHEYIPEFGDDVNDWMAENW